MTSGVDSDHFAQLVATMDRFARAGLNQGFRAAIGVPDRGRIHIGAMVAGRIAHRAPQIQQLVMARRRLAPRGARS